MRLLHAKPPRHCVFLIFFMRALQAARRPAWRLVYAFWLLKNEVLIFVGSNRTCLASGP